MAFASSIVTCSSKEMGSDIWNLYAGNHPDLHDDFMDPPERIMVHSTKSSTDHCTTKKNRECFDFYYGAQSIIQNPYTTSAVMEVQAHCTFTIGETEICDINNNSKPEVRQRKCNSTKDVSKQSKHKESDSKHLLAVPAMSDLKRNKSDSDISSLGDRVMAPRSRPRILSDGSAHENARCVCKCTCGYDNGVVEMDPINEHCHTGHGKSRHKSRSLRGLLHDILS